VAVVVYSGLTETGAMQVLLGKLLRGFRL